MRSLRDMVMERMAAGESYQAALRNVRAELRSVPLSHAPYEHAEAFMLMTYVGDVSGREEVLWNSRDGVTPFVIESRWEPHEALTHRTWSLDRRVPTFVPPVGSRIFVDLTIERAREHARSVDAYRRRIGGPAFDVEEMARGLLHPAGAPDILVVTEDVRERFQRAHDATLRDR